MFPGIEPAARPARSEGAGASDGARDWLIGSIVSRALRWRGSYASGSLACETNSPWRQRVSRRVGVVNNDGIRSVALQRRCRQLLEVSKLLRCWIYAGVLPDVSTRLSHDENAHAQPIAPRNSHPRSARQRATIPSTGELSRRIEDLSSTGSSSEAAKPSD